MPIEKHKQALRCGEGTECRTNLTVTPKVV